MSRSWLLYLDDLIESAEKIERFVAGRTVATFKSDEAILDAVLFNLQVIGEAVKQMPEEARSAMPEVRGGKSPRIKRLSEYVGESCCDHLAGLPELVLLMDESHRYRASAGLGPSTSPRRAISSTTRWARRRRRSPLAGVGMRLSTPKATEESRGVMY